MKKKMKASEAVKSSKVSHRGLGKAYLERQHLKRCLKHVKGPGSKRPVILSVTVQTTIAKTETRISWQA